MSQGISMSGLGMGSMQQCTAYQVSYSRHPPADMAWLAVAICRQRCMLLPWVSS